MTALSSQKSTRIAQCILSAVYRLKEKAQVNEVINHLQGRSTHPVDRDANGKVLSTYGCLRADSREDLQFWVKCLIDDLGFLAVENGRLRFTDQGVRFLKSRQKVHLKARPASSQNSPKTPQVENTVRPRYYSHAKLGPSPAELIPVHPAPERKVPKDLTEEQRLLGEGKLKESDLAASKYTSAALPRDTRPRNRRRSR